jgi:hypothetical protein
MSQLFKPVVEQKVDKGADPKSVLCAFFLKNQCGKGIPLCDIPSSTADVSEMMRCPEHL